MEVNGNTVFSWSPLIYIEVRAARGPAGRVARLGGEDDLAVLPDWLHTIWVGFEINRWDIRIIVYKHQSIPIDVKLPLRFDPITFSIKGGRWTPVQ